MEIFKAQKHQLLEVLYIIRECSHQLLGKGVKYWNNSLADFNDIASDIDMGFVYIVLLKKVPVGTITLKPDKSNIKTLTIKRLATHPAFQKKGIAHQLLTFAIDHAINGQFRVISGQIPFKDESLINLLKNSGFEDKVAPALGEEFLGNRFERAILPT